MKPGEQWTRQWDPQKLKLRSRNLLALEMHELEGDFRLEIPFFVFVGKARKPRSLLIAGIHGDEYESVAALHDLAQQIDPGALRGTLTIAPVSNPQAFYAGTRRNPTDQGDLNRLFPGNPQGTASERVASLLFRNFVLGNDAILSMHCWGKEAVTLPYVEYLAGNGRVSQESFAAARALGLEFLHPYRWHPGLLVAAASRARIPSIEAEVGGMGTVTAQGQQTYQTIIYRYLAHIGILKTPSVATESPHPHPKIIGHSDYLANYAGLFRSNVTIGQRVEKGNTVGRIHDLDGSCLETLRAPSGGVIGILRTFASVQPGDLLAQLFQPSKGLEARAG